MPARAKLPGFPRIGWAEVSVEARGEGISPPLHVELEVVAAKRPGAARGAKQARGAVLNGRGVRTKVALGALVGLGGVEPEHPRLVVHHPNGAVGAELALGARAVNLLGPRDLVVGPAHALNVALRDHALKARTAHHFRRAEDGDGGRQRLSLADLFVHALFRHVPERGDELRDVLGKHLHPAQHKVVRNALQVPLGTPEPEVGSGHDLSVLDDHPASLPLPDLPHLGLGPLAVENIPPELHGTLQREGLPRQSGVRGRANRGVRLTVWLADRFQDDLEAFVLAHRPERVLRGHLLQHGPQVDLSLRAWKHRQRGRQEDPR